MCLVPCFVHATKQDYTKLVKTAIGQKGEKQKEPTAQNIIKS